MKEQIFRKVSLDRVNSPEQLNEYIRVASPGVWLTLAAVILLLLGAFIWGIFGTIETTVSMPVVVEGDVATGYLSAKSSHSPTAGMDVEIDGYSGTVLEVSAEPQRLAQDVQQQVYLLGDFAEGDFYYPVQLSVKGLSDGVYEAKIVVERISPISFVIH